MMQSELKPSSNIRIALLGDYSGNPDEGMKRTACCLVEHLSRHYQVRAVDMKNQLPRGFYRMIREFNPHIIHYIPGPSIISFLIVRVLKFYFPESKLIMSALHPGFYGLKGFAYGPSYALSSLLKPMIRFLKPDLILVQSNKTEQMFQQLGCKTVFLASGVDVSKFVPVTEAWKKELRKKYEIDVNSFIVTHVGSIRAWRNLHNIFSLQDSGSQVVLVGSTSTFLDKRLISSLRKRGVIVWESYLQDVEEIYQLSDCYIFPTTNLVGAIELPLSVFEAMSCNLPTITTKFGGLPRIFSEGGGLFFVESDNDFIEAIEVIKSRNIRIRTREKVIPCSWEQIAKQLGDIYERLSIKN